MYVAQQLNIPSLSRCYTPTEFALFGIGAIVMGVMLGVVGISWFKHQVWGEHWCCLVTSKNTLLSFAKLSYSCFNSQCLPDEKEELRDRERELERQARFSNLTLSSSLNGRFDRKVLGGGQRSVYSKIDRWINFRGKLKAVIMLKTPLLNMKKLRSRCAFMRF